MNFKQLETFVWTVRLGSFSAAADKLNSTQPSVTMRIQELEKSLSIDLFDSPRRASRLTQQGRDLLDYAEKILALSSEAQIRLGDPASITRRVRLGVGETIALTWLPQLIARLNEQFPAMVIESEVDLTAALWSKFDTGDLDVMLLPTPVQGANLVIGDLGISPYTWMANPKLGIPEDRAQSPADLQRFPIITLSRDSVLHEVIEDWFRGSRAEPHRVDVCNSLGVVASLTISGLGISLLPPEIYQREIERGELMVINAAPVLKPIEFISVYRRDREPALNEIIAEIAHDTSTFPTLKPG